MSERRQYFLAAALLVLLCGATFHPLAGFDFTSWDDQRTVAANPRFNPPSIDSIGYYWRHAHMSLYAPLTYTLWGTLAWIAEGANEGFHPLNPAVFHLANLVLHMLAALCVLALGRRLVPSMAAALMAAILFALHPLSASVKSAIINVTNTIYLFMITPPTFYLLLFLLTL
jgi:hypothetical protein